MGGIFGLERKNAVVTGGGRGIGRAICLALAGAGADVAVVSTTPERNQAVAREVEGLGRRATHYAADVSDASQVEKMARAVLREWGRVDILVCNAGIQRRSSFLKCDLDDWKRVIEVNLYGTFHCLKAFLPGMVERGGGRVVVISSIMGKLPNPFNSSYAASKHAQLGLVRTLAGELALMGAGGVTVNAVCPGITDTDMITGPQGTLTRYAEKQGISVDEAWDRAFRQVSLQGRLLDPSEVAAAVVYLCSEEARGVTGQALNVCGGAAFC